MDPPLTRIVLVEDDFDQLGLMSRILQSAGFAVIRAYGGEDALRKVKAHKPDLILTDLAMPKMSGVEIIQALKRDPETRHIPCLAVTAYIWEAIAEQAEKAGCDGFIGKPFSSAHLVEEVKRFLRSAGA